MNTKKPEIYTDEHALYLRKLRDSGVVNMYGAGPYLQRDFGLTKQETREILSYWMGIR